MTRGPVPKRSDRRMGHHKPEGPPIGKGMAGDAPGIPEPHEDWHPIALDWYESLADSGQSQYYEASDWATAVYVAEAMSRNLSAGKFSAQLFQSVHSAMTELLTTEGARRRARIELERHNNEVVTEDPKVALMDAYRQAAGGK